MTDELADLGPRLPGRSGHDPDGRRQVVVSLRCLGWRPYWGAIVAPQSFRLSEMRQFLQLLCVAPLGLMVFLDFERHQHAFAAAAAQGGVLTGSGAAEEHAGPGAPGARTGPAAFAGSIERNATSASSEPAEPAVAAPSQSGSSSDAGAFRDSDAHGHPAGDWLLFRGRAVPGERAVGKQKCARQISGLCIWGRPSIRRETNGVAPPAGSCARGPLARSNSAAGRHYAHGRK